MSSKFHPDSRLNPSQHVSNDSNNENILDLIEQRELNRRGFLKSTLSATAGATAAAVLGTNIVDGIVNQAHAAPPPVGGIGFTSVPPTLPLRSPTK
jgi:TAT (twin-arginine translocation) pathway signal sequence.